MSRARAAPGVWGVTAPNPGPLTLDGTRSWLVGGRRVALVDPGPDDAGHLERLEAAAEGRRVVAVCLTHAHADHAAAAAAAARRFSAPVVAAAETLRRLAPLGAETRAMADGDAVALGAEAGELLALEAPGHSADHTCWMWLPSRALFTGDAVLGAGSSLVVHPDGRVGSYLASLSRLIALQPGTLYPGHGPPVAEGRRRLEEYRRHRLERDRQVREAVEAGAGTAAEVRRRVYGEAVPAGLEGAAELQVLAHLAHLREIGIRLPEELRRALEEEEPTARLGGGEAP